MATTTFSNLSNDARKKIAAKVLSLAHKDLVFEPFGANEKQGRGNGTTAYWYRYERLNAILAAATEGTTPAAVTMSNTEVSATVSQYIGIVTITDILELALNHPALEQAEKLIADVMARTIDRLISDVVLAGSGVSYGGVATARGGVTSLDTITSSLIRAVVAQLRTDGARPYESGHYIGIVHPDVEADILGEGGSSGFVDVLKYQHAERMMKAEIGQWQGVRWMRSNHLPIYKRITTVSDSDLTAGTGGSLTSASTYYFKAVRKDKTDGFADEMTAEFSKSPGGSNTRLTFTAPAAAGFVYDLYAGSATGDANLFLATSNVEPSGTFNVDTIPTSGATAPVTPAASVSVYPCLVIGEEAFGKTSLQDLETFVTPRGAVESDPAAQRRHVSGKVAFKSVRLNENFMRRIEVAS